MIKLVKREEIGGPLTERGGGGASMKERKTTRVREGDIGEERGEKGRRDRETQRDRGRERGKERERQRTDKYEGWGRHGDDMIIRRN